MAGKIKQCHQLYHTSFSKLNLWLHSCLHFTYLAQTKRKVLTKQRKHNISSQFLVFRNSNKKQYNIIIEVEINYRDFKNTIWKLCKQMTRCNFFKEQKIIWVVTDTGDVNLQIWKAIV